MIPKYILMAAVSALVFYWLGSSIGREIGRESCVDRYELRDSGIVGLVIRLDKQTGETKAIGALESVQR